VIEYHREKFEFEETIVSAAIKRGQPIPDGITNAPQLAEFLEIYLVAYYELETCRPVGMEVGMIPWTAINEYALRHCIEGFEFDYFVKVIRGVDNGLRRLQQGD